MSTAQKLIAATSGVSTDPDPPIGMDVDDSNDYLVRSSDFTDNSDNKTFTFSVWAYATNNTDAFRLYAGEGNWTYFIHTDKTVDMSASNSSNTQILGVTGTHNSLPIFTWNHILISMDMANASNRYIYFNDVNVTSDFTFSTYTDDNIDFTRTAHSIITNTTGGGGDECRIAGVYLDYTYRDLTTASNRRLFIDADGLYVTPPTTGIMSVTISDTDSPGTNSGTGGDFTLNGTIARSGRGPNQYNGQASTFDGSNDNLTRTSLTGAADSKLFTFSCNFKRGNSGNRYLIDIDNSGTIAFVVQLEDAGLMIIGSNAANSAILFYSGGTDLLQNKWYSLQISIDMSNTSKRHVLLDGVDAGGSYSVYTDDSINFTTSSYRVAGASTPMFAGEISDLYFQDGEYIDLSSSNPFFDTETYKPKNLGATGSEPTGTSPIIYLPLNGNNAGNNKGTGGDFTVNSGPFTGARGPSEFWASAASFDGSAQYLNRTGSALSGASDGKILTFAVAFNADSISGTRQVFRISDGGGDGTGLNINGGDIAVFGQASDTANVLWMRKGTSSVGASGLSTDTWHTVLFSANLTNASLRHWYVDNVSVPSPTIGAYTNTNIDFTNTDHGIAARSGGSDKWDGEIGFLYVSQEYIDFSSEANRLKFFDAFGFPVDLGSDGSTPTGTQPLIYINKGFHSGTNSGSGGNFTAQGTPTDGGYVKG